MRLLPGQDQFNNFLLKLGSNRLPTKQEQPFRDCIQIPDQGSLIDSIFSDGLPEYQMASHVILTLRNDTSLTINQQILQRQVWDVTKHFAADHAEVPDNPDEELSTGICAYTYTIWDATTYFRAKCWVHCYAAEEPWSNKWPMQQYLIFCAASLQK